MSRAQRRLIGFAALLAALFTGGWAVGDQFPVDDPPAIHEGDHGSDVTTGDHSMDHATDDTEVTP